MRALGLGEGEELLGGCGRDDHVCVGERGGVWGRDGEREERRRVYWGRERGERGKKRMRKGMREGVGAK